MSDRHLFEVLVDFAYSLGGRSIKDLPGCWEHRWMHDRKEWLVATHAGEGPRKTSTGAEIGPGLFFVECNGWPAGIVEMNGWTIAAGSVINEAAFRAAVAAARAPAP